MPRSRARSAVAAAAAAALITAGGAARADDRYALGMFHFNIQYVAGGMVGYFPEANPIIDLDADTIEDRIVTESFAPVLELYAKHPTWGVDVELQGYFLDVLAARHPATLDLLRTLSQSGQIEVVSFHYSDQLFVAHPRDDWARSQALTAATFDKHGVVLGGAVFCQEGQAGTVMAREMKARGYTTMVWPKNLWIYQHGDFAPDPYYRFGDITLVAGSLGVDWQGNGRHVQTAWTFFDDGELLATGGQNPYFPDLFKKKDKALAEYEANLSALEAQGFAITTVSKYVEAVKDALDPQDPPPLLDGTWQPNSTDGVHRWLGAGGLWGKDERDNDVRTLANIAHRELLAAETIAAQAGIDASAEIASAWRLLALGEVSDASGINPFRGEIEYGIAHMTEALRVARDVIRLGKEVLGVDVLTIDPAAGTVRGGETHRFDATRIDAPLTITSNGDDRSVQEMWFRVRPNVTVVSLLFGSGESRRISVTFPGVADAPIETTLALDDETPASFDRAAFDFEHFYLPLPIGMVGLGGGRYLIEDQARVHVAAQVFRDKGEVVIADETQTAGESVRWMFYLVEGSAEDAVAFARELNDRREVSR